jgi:large subunit ribosomal protein L25
MEQYELRANSRTVLGKKVKNLRIEEVVPAVIYGPDTPSRPIQAPERSLMDILRQAGSTQLVNVFVDDEKEATMALARDISRDVMSGRLLHVDFYQVRLTETVKTSPRLEYVGESPAIDSGTAVLIENMSSLDIECLPTDLVSSITVDISGLEELEDSVIVSDLDIPPGITVLADPGDVVVSLVTTRAALVEEDLVEDLEGLEELEEGEGEYEDGEEAPEED